MHFCSCKSISHNKQVLLSENTFASAVFKVLQRPPEMETWTTAGKYFKCGNRVEIHHLSVEETQGDACLREYYKEKSEKERERERERERSVLFNVEALYSGLEDLETLKRRFKDLKAKKSQTLQKKKKKFQGSSVPLRDRFEFLVSYFAHARASVQETCIITIIVINHLTARVVGAPQMILQPVFSIFPCSPLPSGTCRTPLRFMHARFQDRPGNVRS